MIRSHFLPGLDYRDRHWYTPGGWQELFLVGAAYRLGIFKALADTPLEAGKLAKEIKTNKRATTLLLEALEAAGYLGKKGVRYSPTKKAVQMLVDERHPDFIGYAVSHSMRLAERWLTLPQILVSGKPIAGDRFSETIKGFVKAMDVYARATAVEAVKLCLERLPGARSVLDIGGATGTVSRLFAKRGLDVTLLDLPEVVELARKELSTLPNLLFVGGDFNESTPQGPFDIIFMGNITHIYGPNKNLSLFKRAADALVSGGLLAILDYVRGMSPSAPFFGINMLVNTEEGGTWTVEEYTDWLNAAGFGAIEFIDMEKRDQQLMVAKR